MQLLQSIQRSLTISTACSPCCRAATGQAATQGAFLHCLHITGVLTAFCFTTLRRGKIVLRCHRNRSGMDHGAGHFTGVAADAFHGGRQNKLAHALFSLNGCRSNIAMISSALRRPWAIAVTTRSAPCTASPAAKTLGLCVCVEAPCSPVLTNPQRSKRTPCPPS